MNCIVHFGRTVGIVDARGRIISYETYKYCRSVVEARRLRDRYGGYITRMIDGVPVRIN